ncbi:alpha,alpha-trehalase TreF [Kozakia baliensis]|uniref:alpha,alpha-trehalase TreF n=1 Tax=Kozakia baliensis TaxID=153496 RepID=UPI0009F26614|nr:alpha,alpha-trehalase TreF [Kozakia baliensis]
MTQRSTFSSALLLSVSAIAFSITSAFAQAQNAPQQPPQTQTQQQAQPPVQTQTPAAKPTQPVTPKNDNTPQTSSAPSTTNPASSSPQPQSASPAATVPPRPSTPTPQPAATSSANDKNAPPAPRPTVESEAATGMRMTDVPQDLRSPSIALGGLFAAIGGAHLEPDFKTIADATPDEAPSRLLQDWQQQRLQPGFSIKTFYEQHFSPPIRREVNYKRRANENIFDYIQGMWGVLTRQPDKPIAYSSLLPLPYAYVVPGGRFSELYYWDTYFTMIGLYESGQIDLMRGMIMDMASQIDRYDHIPNGTRTYYLSRSEPPYFALMVDLLAQHDGQSTYRKFLPELQREHDYWMDGAAKLPRGQAYRHVVRLKDGTLLNRHWDDLDTPRDESYPEDVETANNAKSRPPSDVYRDLRAGGETGWDFSSRWLADGHTLATIHTTDLVTIELNSLMAHLEQTLAHAYAVSGKLKLAGHYGDMAEQRTMDIRRLMWNDDQQAFFDYDWKAGQQTTVLSSATAVPLFLRIATQAQALAVAETIREKLLKPGGLVVTDRHSGQQWDAPNGWAPAQWMAIKGLNNYGASDLATEIARRWMARVIGTYEKSGVLLEKYDVEAPNISPTGGKGGGEYPMQIGFGWTNGTLLGLMNRYPLQTNQILQRNPLANQAPIQALPPLDPYSAEGPETTPPASQPAPANKASDASAAEAPKPMQAATTHPEPSSGGSADDTTPPVLDDHDTGTAATKEAAPSASAQSNDAKDAAKADEPNKAAPAPEDKESDMAVPAMGSNLAQQSKGAGAAEPEAQPKR